MSSNRFLSLKFLLTVPFVGLVLLVSIIILSLSIFSTWKVSDALISRLGIELNNEIRIKLEQLVAAPITLNHVNYNAIKSGGLNIDNREMRDRYFARQMEVFPEISYSFYGMEDSSFYGARRNEKNEIQVILNNKSTKNSSLYFSVDQNMNRESLQVEIKNFDCRTRPWYKAAAKLKKPVFSKIYRHFVYKDLAITASHPVFDNHGKLLGVLGVDYRLDRINSYLQSIKLNPLSKILIVERKTGLMVGNSMGLKNYFEVGGKLTRLRPNELYDEIVTELYERLRGKHEFRKIDQLELKTKISDGTYHLSLSNFKYHNLDWQIFIYTPETEFSESIRNHVGNSIAICLFIIIVATLLGLAIVAKVTRPIDQLVEASIAISQGQWDYTSPEAPYKELDHLSQTFNIMARQLRTSFSHLEDTVRDRTSELEEKNSELIKANDTKDQLFKIVAHDLRGPVGTIAALLDELTEHYCGRSECPLVSSLDALAKSSNNVYELLNHLLTWAMGQTGEISFNPAIDDINNFIRETLGSLVQQADLKDIALQYSPISIDAYFDYQMMLTVYRNLISNAIKFTPVGGFITTTVEEEQGFVKVSVIDSGTGMSEEEIKLLFTPKISTVKRTGTAGEKGTGLGLLLCKEFVETNGGTIAASITSHGGMCFWFKIPTVPSNSGEF